MNSKSEKTDIIVLGKYTEGINILCNALSFRKATHSVVLLSAMAQLRKRLMQRQTNTILILSVTSRDSSRYLELIARLRIYPHISIAVYCPAGIPLNREELFAVGANIIMRTPSSRADLERSVRKVMLMNTQFASGNLKRETYFLST